jgi:glutaconyl-CoA/methylmalonyl-CoA decarboxylase subunit gamma
MKYHLEINKKNFDVTISGISGNMAHVLVNGQPYEVSIGKPPQPGAQPAADHLSAAAQTAATPSPLPAQKPETSLPSGMPGQELILAPIPGLILEIKVKVGEAVSAGQTVAVLEAMKMENSLTTHVSGTVMEIRVEKSSEVSTGDVILIIDNQQF